jgi:thiol-disulfide isomerase/thioredoxin
MHPPVVRCPEFPASLTWINTRRPLTVAVDLKGRVTILDFWTHCCINCMHVLPVLSRVEEIFSSDPVQVIGVHCAKFPSERDPDNVRSAVRRHQVKHPVVVDSQHQVWDRFAVRAWPTLVLVDAAGYVRETISGEVEEEVLSERVRALLEEGRKNGTLLQGPPGLAPESEAAGSYLRFPGKLHLFQDRLFVADSGHQRIVVSNLQGEVETVVGTGEVGARDGPAASATFSNPQGLAVAGGCLYVADTGNHLLRCFDLASREVRTVAGTGEKGTLPRRVDPARPRETPLRSPWGLHAIGSQILIAMAGSHQVWIFDTEKQWLAPWAGSGREDHLDGELREAAFAQPSGLAQAGKLILVADSEVSSVRAIDLLEGRVRTIVGRGLFDFGDADGRPEQVLLQHPLDVAVGDNCVYIADSFNNKIKAVAFGSMETRTLFGDGNPATLHEPGGLAFASGWLYIADTNNHRILKGDPASGRLQELELRE